MEAWTLLSTPPGELAEPDVLPPDAEWRPALVPGTVAQAIGPDDLDRHPSYDATDWWYRCTLPATGFGAARGARHRLRFDGLATLAEVWFNGERVLTSSNMFCAHEVDVTDLVRAENTLAIAFRSLDAALSQRRPRPRWKTKLVENQQLRWFRTTLLGRIPGWTPPIAPVGPWRGVWMESEPVLDVVALDLRTSVGDGRGAVKVKADVRPLTEGVRVTSATLRVGGRDLALGCEIGDDGWRVGGSVGIERPALWWPATHGEPALHECALEIETSAGSVAVDCGRLGFRKLELDRSGGRIRFLVNGVPIFCRGSCWTTNDIVSLVGDPERMRRTLTLLAEANGNMVRVGGTMLYETDDFYRTCDELGLMVWQDFMFANMDYPVDDASFGEAVQAEAEHQLERLSRHPSVVAFCGGSEVEQQAAMFGAPKEIWSNRFFTSVLPSLVRQHAPEAPYWTSTPTGGALPFHVGEGLAHYYGVGAYRRPLEDARLAGVRFSPECLGFSHVPDAENLRKLTRAGAVPPHDPAWKRGVPRDTGPGWDFEDVRDHYLEQLYGVHAVRLRSEDLERYLALSRIVTGEVMERVFAEWRGPEDPCGGALTWFLNDLRPGAGWGVIDSDGRPKAAYHHLKRAWAPECVQLLDRGLDGVVALVVNESDRDLDAGLELLAFGRGGHPVAALEKALRIPAWSSEHIPVEAAFGQFVDSTYSYRFGPPRHLAIVARLLAEDGRRLVSEAVYRPISSALPLAAGPSCRLAGGPDGGLTLTLTAETTLFGVHIDVKDHAPADDYFVLTPGRPRSIALRRVSDSGRAFQGYVHALNLADAIRLSEPE